ncbi:Uu.00g089760.m01.CDS01 [Anthostomella pinea]|uniref:Uu.00g089760.m01.CDS01 n=1 Tax=Anthostomella pinea TaxID=933095 RepID=A0AAI8VMS8_9PEZI|nr:Uu.00g089760.m01.CDS01 [Anthostomella pinea]
MSLAEQPQCLSEASDCEDWQTELARKVTAALTEHSRNSFTTAYDEDTLDLYMDMDDDQCMIEEATILDAREMKTKEVMIEPPALPQRNALRTSKLLDSLKLNSINSATQSLHTPHDIYLSSEEDPSSSADDFSDYEYGSSSEESEKSPARRRSQEDTARAVSVIYVGKPCIVDLASGRRTATPLRRPKSSVFDQSLSSSSSSLLSSDSLDSRPKHPPRHSSLTPSRDVAKAAPAFLQQDPFATGCYKLDTSTAQTSSTANPRVPKTPTTPTAAFQRFQKSISLARKRSRPNLKAPATSTEDVASTPSRSTTNLLYLNTSPGLEEAPMTPEPMSAITPTTPQTPITYHEILRSARKNSISFSSYSSSPAMSPISPATAKRGILSGLNMNRRRSSISVRIRP